MRTTDLEYFLTVAETHSMNKASQKLDIAYQSINAGIKNLENELGVTLFTRTSHGVYLTKEGETAKSFISNILKDVELLKHSMRTLTPCSNNQQNRGHLSVGSSANISNLYLPEFLSEFRHKYPNIQLTIKECPNKEIIDMCLQKQFDLCLLSSSQYTSDFNPYPTKLKFNLYMQTAISAYMSNKHPLATRKSLSVNTITKYPLAIYSAFPSDADELKNAFIHSGAKKFSLSTSVFSAYLQSIWDNKTILVLPNIKEYTAYLSKFVSSENTVLIPIYNSPIICHFVVTHLRYSSKQQALVDLFLESFQSFIEKLKK